MITILVGWLLMPVGVSAGLHLAARTWPSYILMLFTSSTVAVVFGSLDLTIPALGALTFMIITTFLLPHRSRLRQGSRAQ